MKKFFIGLAVVGVMAAIAAGALIAVGYSKSKEDSATINRTVDIEDTFENFDFDVMTTGITVKKASDGKTKVEISENKKCPNEVKVEGNTLKIKQVDQRKWYEKIFGWTWLFEDLKVTVYVAGDTYNTFKCESNTGSINVESGFTFSTLTATNNTGSIHLSSNVTGNIQCDNNTGSVNLTGLEAGSINITNDTGSINITDVNVSGEIKVEEDTGSVNFKNVHCNSIDVDGGTGSVNVKDTIATGNMKIKTSTGSINFDASDADSLNLKTSTGSIKGTLLTSKIFSARSSTGKVDVPTSTTGGLCVAETSTGSIKLSIVGA